MAFWLDLGVDGFRVDMAASLVKRDPHGIYIRRLWREVREWLDANYADRVLIAEWGEPERAVDAGFHVDFMLHFGVPGYDALFFGPECRFPPGRRECYFDASAQGDFQRFWEAFSFQHERIRGRGYLSIPSGNHDFQRPSSGRDSADLKVIQTFLLTWPQIPFLYYGDEIGMRYLADLPSKEGGYERTGSRTPMQWDDSSLAGFSAAAEQLSYLPIDPSPDRPNVAAQRADKDSLWHHVERLIYLRQTEPDLLPDAPVELLSEGNGYPLVYRRGETLLIALNPGSQPHEVRLERTGDAATVLAYHCRVSHDERGWILHIGARGYGIFGIR
jgi:maltose alpha-D-glucosyltransferase/alpha-amylase